MVHDEMVTEPPWTKTPPPNPHPLTPHPYCPQELAVFPLMVHDDKVTVPPLTRTPPPDPQQKDPCRAEPPVMFSPMICTTPDDPGLTISTRNALPPSSTTKPATAASMTTLLVTLSVPLRK